MPRTKKRKQPQSQKAKKVAVAQIKMNTALGKIDELARQYQEEVNNKIKLIQENTNKQLLQMKWTDFLALNIKQFADHHSVPEPVSQEQAQIQTLDLSFLRWPRAGELVLSMAGSPLAVLGKPELCAHAHIPTTKGVISVKPHKMQQVDTETLIKMDQKTLNQVKVLNTNLGMIVDMATKMGKL